MAAHTDRPAPSFPHERFAEIRPGMLPEEALSEAQRCLYCYDAPCVKACPTHIDVPRFIKQIASGDIPGSAVSILEANAMGHSCARVCPVEVLCEGACVYLGWHKAPIEIARLQRFATDRYFAAKERAFRPGPDNGLPVAVVGAGPAGLACAFYLRRLGHPVTLFERRELGGGLNSFGVAEYKMTRRVALEEVRHVLDMGVDLRLGVEAGKDVPPTELEKRFKAIFIGVGLGQARALRLEGETLEGVWDALAFIERIKDHDMSFWRHPKSVVVLGGGNTAIDAVTQSKRLGCPKVLLAYRRDPSRMSAYAHEYELAKSDEVEFLWNASPTGILGSKRVEGVRFVRTRSLGDGLRPIPGSEFIVPCDLLIKATGQLGEPSLPELAGLRLGEGGTIRVDPATLAASRRPYYAGGDAVNGGKEVVNAAADGKKAAWSIHRALAGGKGETVPYWARTIEGGPDVAIPARALPSLRRSPARRAARRVAP